MLVTSSQSSTQRPLGLSVEELFALDHQYRRIEQQQHLAQLQNQARVTSSSNLNRLNSRSLDLISSTNPQLTVLPSLEVQGHGYTHRPQPPPITTASVLNYARSHSIDQLRYTPPVFSTPSSKLLKPTYNQRSTTNDSVQQTYHSRYRTNLQHPLMATSTPPSLGNNIMHNIPPSSIDYNNDARNSCKLRRQQPIKRESSRRIVVRPVVQRRREPSISSSCESLDELRLPTRPIPTEQSNIFNQSAPYTPSTLLINDIIDDSKKKSNNLTRSTSNNDSLSDDSDINLYEMRVPIGKTYDTSDISVQLEGPKILIHCHTIEPTDKRGNYRKHEFKTELLVPDIVDDETIVAYLTEDGQLIVEGKYQSWAWEDIKRKRKIEQQKIKSSSSPILQSTSPLSPPPLSSTNSTLTSTRNDGDLQQEKISPSLISNNQRIMYNNNNNNNTPLNTIETLNNNRTLIHIGESTISSQQNTDTKSVSDIINRFNTLNTISTPTIWDGQYTFTNDIPPLLIYHIRLPFETLMDSIRIQADSELNLLKIFIEQQERNLLSQYEQQQQQQQQNKIIIRSTSRYCRLPKDHRYDYTHLRVIFLKDNFIRIELPTLN